MLVLVWFSLIQVGSVLVQFWFSLGSVLIQFGSVLAQFWFRFVHFGLCWFNFGSVWLMVGSVGSSLVQFRINVGEVSVHVEDDVWFSCGSVWFSVLVYQFWFWFGTVWFRLVQRWSSFGLVLVHR